MLADHYAALFPLYSDLSVTLPGARVRMVTAGSVVAFQWMTATAESNVPRNFQVVLFPDGTIRFDYPGPNPPSSPARGALVGVSTGQGYVDVLTGTALTAPSTSIVYRPNALGPVSSIPAGNLTLTVPAASSVVRLDPACSVAVVPTAMTDGVVSCPQPLRVGTATFAADVVIAVPASVLLPSSPPNLLVSSQWAGASEREQAQLLARTPQATITTFTHDLTAPSPPRRWRLRAPS